LKRRDLVRHLETHGCELLREGANHPSTSTEQFARSQPCHGNREINELLARKICRDLEVSCAVMPNKRLKLPAPVLWGRIAFVDMKARRRSLGASR